VSLLAGLNIYFAGVSAIIVLTPLTIKPSVEGTLLTGVVKPFISSSVKSVVAAKAGAATDNTIKMHKNNEITFFIIFFTFLFI